MRIQTTFIDDEGERRVNKDIRNVIVRKEIVFDAGETKLLTLPLGDGNRRLVYLESNFTPETQSTRVFFSDGGTPTIYTNLVPQVGCCMPITVEDTLSVTNNSNDEGRLTLVVLDD